MSEFDALSAAMKRIESYSKATEEHWRKIASSMATASKKGGGVAGKGGQRGHGKSSNTMDGSTAEVSGSDEETKKKSVMAQSRKIYHTPINQLQGGDALQANALGRAAGRRVENGQAYAGNFGADGRPIGGMAGRIDRMNQNRVGSFLTSGGTFGSMGFRSLPEESQARIASSMYGMSDTLSLMRGISSGTNSFMPGVQDVMNRATGYYNATLYGGNQRTRSSLRDMTYGTMAGLQGITSAGSDAHVAQFLASRGMSASSGANSTYQQTLRTVANAGRYMNISNEEAVASVEGMTSAKGAAEMLRNFGIYTADLNTGKEKTQAQIFEELAQRLTAGRGQANVEQTQASIRRGALGVTIDSFFQGDQQGGTMFKQYMIERAAGKKMDLSLDSMVSQPEGNRNPLNAQYELTQKETGAMNYAEKPYIGGINAATKALGLLTDVSGGLVQALGGATAMIQTLFGNKRVQGITEGLTSVVDFASKGISGIGSAIAGMDMSLPPYSTIPALTEAGIIAGSMGASLVTAASLGGATLGMGALAGASGGPEKSIAISNGNKMMGGRNSARQMFTGSGGMGMSSRKISSKPASGGALGASDGAGQTSSNVTSAGRTSGPTPMFNFDWLNGYTVSTQYGVVDAEHSRPHQGTDFAMSAGTDVKAVGDGVVQKVGTDPNDGLGIHVFITHTGTNGRTMTSIYGHMIEGSVTVSEGQNVTKGQVIGQVGNTGHSTGPHLHLEFREGANGQSGASLSMTEAGKMLSDGSNSDGSSWNNGSGSDSQGSSGYNISAANAAMDEAKGYQKTPPAATAAMAVLKGLYSGNQNSITASMKQIAANMGVSGSDWNKYMSGETGSLPNSPVAPPGGYRPPNPAGSPINNNVSITVQVPDVTSADAIKFGQLVKQYLDNNTLTSNTGSL